MNILLILFALLLFNLIIFIHEFGHFYTAKMFGVKVNEFAIGMGPKIFKFKKGETLYSLRAFPIGGFCEMEGEDSASDSEGSFTKIKAWKRIIVVAAGAIMNMFLGLVFMLILFAQRPYFLSTTISKFSDDAVSNQYGLMEGDTILSVDGSGIISSTDLSFSLTVDGKDSFDLKVRRGNEIVDLENVRFGTTEGQNGKKITTIDFAVETVPKSFWTLIKYTIINTLSTVKVVWSSFIGLLTGRFSLNNVTGFVGIASTVNKVTNESLKVNVLYAINNIIDIMALISFNLGIINLLPLPAVDGGRIIFLLFEVITGKPVNSKYEGWVHAAGFVLFILLTIVITFSDIMRIVKGG